MNDQGSNTRIKTEGFEPCPRHWKCRAKQDEVPPGLVEARRFDIRTFESFVDLHQRLVGVVLALVFDIGHDR